VVSKGWTIDAKSTVAGSFSVNLKKFLKLRREAFASGRKAAVAVHFEMADRTLYVIDEDQFMDLHNMQNERKNP